MATKILVVDDDPAISLLVRQVLVREGYEVRIAGSGEQALERLDRESFDLLITDKNMPEMTGLQLIRAVRQRRPTLPVILMTAYPGAREDSLPIQGYLAKPFARLQQIIEVVSSTLALSRLLAEMRGRREPSAQAAPLIGARTAAA